ncbi:cobalt-precorrin-6A reductase [Haloechinothrix halophila]|uniref:cobalt-precorrin-6A reductase n=1 Tax=Haloechinothrix halophila TaxID=1069073 RepID=UPI0003F4F151
MSYPVLILGGTSEARALAAALHARGVAVMSSLAGRVERPRLPEGEVRLGGFGGPDGLTAWLAKHDVRAVVDATHPFAARITDSAVAATARAGVPLLRLERPGWTQPDGADWRWVDSLEEAAELLPSLGERAFLTSGRQGLAAFADVDAVWFLIRCVDPPEAPLPQYHELLLDRGPYTVDRELELLRTHRIDVLVSKDSGGSMTAAKLTAAARHGIPSVIVRRPPRPDTPTVSDVDDALHWALEVA